MSIMYVPSPLKGTPEPKAAPAFNARDLVGHDGTGRIVLEDQIYVLRITKAGKLILTK